MADKSEDGSDEARNPINDLYRLANIERWHIVHMNQKQSVAEHSYNVTILAMRLASAIGAPVGRTVQYALLHDAEEAWTGDIPSPMKNRGHEVAYPLAQMMGDMYIDNIAPVTRYIVKLCDLAEGIKFLSIHGGSRHTIMVGDKMRERLWELAGHIMDEFPNFGWDLGLAEINFYLDNSEETFIDDYV